MTPSHERPILLVLRPGDRPGDAMRGLLAHPSVRQHWLPPIWVLERAGIDLADALPGTTAVTLEALPKVVDAAIRLATPEALDALVARMWRTVDEQVRAFYLGRRFGSTLAAIFRLSPRSLDVTPPPRFREDRIHENGFEVQYRIDPAPGDRNVLAPAEEASLVLYPFDPANAEARREADLGAGPEAVLEVFAYDDARPRHRAVLEDVSRTTGWRVVDPTP